MSSTTATRAQLAAVQPRHAMIARALAWEECRVGGMVAAVCAVVGVALIALVRVYIGPRGWASQDAMLVPFVLFVPLLLAMLLILNPANSGHLGGGFARRVLWLPVPVPLAVGVSMGMRAAFLLGASSAVIAVTRWLYEGGPSYTLGLTFVLFYLAVQTLDWARAVLSGLTTLILAALLAGSLPLAVQLGNIMLAFTAFPERLGPVTLFLLTCAVTAVTYGISVAAVTATRKGWMLGIPEAWEWGSGFEWLSTARRPFQTPVAAQVWYELRQYGWTLPAVTLLLPLILGVGPWLFAPSDELGGLAKFSAGMMFLTFPLGAVAHGIRARALGIRANPGTLPFAYRMPLSAGDMALAKSLAAWIVILPTVLFVHAYQIAVFAPAFITEVIPYAWSEGMTTAREVVWALGSRGILFALGAWLLIGLGTRTVRRMIIPLPVAFLLLLSWEVSEPDTPQAETMLASVAKVFFQTEEITGAHTSHLAELAISWAILLLIAGTAVGAMARAWWLGLVSRRTLGGWAAAWVLVALLFAAQLPEPTVAGPRGLADYFHEAIICLAWASIVPLVFAAFALDIARRRHGRAVRQTTNPPHAHGRTRTMPWAVGSAAAVFVVWLAWPAEPAYRDYLRAQGLPANEAEFLAEYRSVPHEENISRRYEKLIQERNGLNQARHERWRESGDANMDDVFSFGETEWPLTDIQQAATLQYWEEVTSKVAPTLVDLAMQLDGRRPGGYTTSLSPFDSFDLNRYGGLRNLMGEARLDAYYWSLQGDSARTADAIIAIIGVSDSMADDWDIMEIHNRAAYLWAAVSSLERALKSVEFADDDLARMAHRFETAWNPEEVELNSLRYQQFASLRLTEYIALVFLPDMEPELASLSRWMLLNPVSPAVPLAFSPPAERMATLSLFAERFDEVVSREHLPVSERQYRPRSSDAAVRLEFLAWFSSMFMGVLSHLELSTTEADIRLLTARTGIAAERFRLSHGRWPESLDELVPAYMDAIPIDQLAAEPGTPLRMMLRDGAFVVYSAGRSGEDNGGCSRSDDDCEGDDITFVVGQGRE